MASSNIRPDLQAHALGLYTYLVEPQQDESALREWVLKSKPAFDLLANKWRLTIVHVLSLGTLRYGHLHRALGKISHKVLTQALRSLEHDGIIERRNFPVVPPRVEYSLTPLGQSLVEPLGHLCRWAQEHEAEIAAAQSSFDEKERMWSYSIDSDDTDSSWDGTVESSHQ